MGGTKPSTKILLVDDVKDNLLALDALLRRDDIQIFQAGSGVEALECMAVHEFALALIDVRMPSMSGIELAELMRGTNRTRNIPIIFVTATAKSQILSFKGYESGAVDFLLKPLDAHAVRSKVNIFVQLYRNQIEQKELLAQLTTTQLALEEAVKLREEFMSIASHELKTPLTSLKLQSQLRMRYLEKDAQAIFTTERLKQMFAADSRQIERITHLVDDMLDISRITSGRLSMNLEKFDLCALVQDIISRNSDQFVAAGCLIQVDAGQAVVGSWDRFRIEQVIVNLLTNSMRYGAGKPISIHVTELKGGAQVIVRDQGRGIADENHERIFQRFERAASGDGLSGLGLGLYIVKQILTAHQGSIRVESKLGEGAAFIFDLPPAGHFDGLSSAI